MDAPLFPGQENIAFLFFSERRGNPNQPEKREWQGQLFYG
jgi:hypothetical protein